jgi:GT2 family glycosyltransferase
VKPLAVVPVYLARPEDVQRLLTCVGSLRATAGGSLDILLVDDCSPRPDLVALVEGEQGDLEFELHRKEVNSGFAKTVNVGLRRCLAEGRDAVLVNQDIALRDDRWLRCMLEQLGGDGRGLASVVGGLLLFPGGRIQHAGVCRGINQPLSHIYRYAPGDLPEARTPRACPVTAALQFIRHECLQAIGVYDEDFPMGYEDVDYCLRTMLSGRACVYQPKIVAYHVERSVRPQHPSHVAWRDRGLTVLNAKHSPETLAAFVPRDLGFDYWDAVHRLHKVERASERAERRMGRAEAAIAQRERLQQKVTSAKRDRDEARARLSKIERTRLWRWRTLALRVGARAGLWLSRALRASVRG